MSSMLEGLALFAGGLGKATIARGDEIAAQKKAAEKEAYERGRQAIIDKQTAEKHDIEMQTGKQQIASNDIKIKDDTEIYKQNHNMRHWTQGYTNAKAMYDAGDINGMLSTIADTTNADETLGYTVDYQKDADGNIAYTEKDGKRYVTMVSTDRKNGRQRSLVVSPDQVLSANAQMTNPQKYAESEMAYQDWAKKADKEFSIYQLKGNYDLKNTKDLETFKDGINDGNVQVDYQNRVGLARLGSQLNIEEGNAQAQRQIQVASQTPDGKLTLALTPYKIQEAKADAITAGAQATTAQITAQQAKANPQAVISAPKTKKEIAQHNKYMSTFPQLLSKNIGKNSNAVSKEMSELTKVDPTQTKLAINKFNSLMVQSLNEPDFGKAKGKLYEAMNALQSVMPPSAFGGDASKRNAYLNYAMSKLTGHGSLEALSQDLLDYKNYRGMQGYQLAVTQAQQGGQKPTLTMPTTAPQAKQPTNNNTPYQGVQLNTQPVQGANQKLANDVLK